MARKDRNVFTIMIVPHAETKVFTFRLSTIAFQALCYVLVCVFLFMIIVARSYQTMVSNMWELEELRVVNRQQREQIDQLVDEANSLQQRMVTLDELDMQVREMMEMESYDSGEDSAAISLVTDGSSSGAAMIASVGIGGGAVSSGAGVSRTSIRDAQDALDMLGELGQEVGERSQSLEEVRTVISDSMAYVMAKPSIWPAFGYVSSGYGYRHSSAYGSELHEGYDIAAKTGTPIVATADGTVTYAGWGSLGNTIEIDHGYGWTTVYGHASKIAVQVGDRVKKGEVIAFIGSTGRSTGPHVHYEVRINGKSVNPRYYLG